MSQEIRKNIIDIHVKGKVYKTLSKQHEVPLTTVLSGYWLQSLNKREIGEEMDNTKSNQRATLRIKGEGQGQGTSVSDCTLALMDDDC